MAPKPPRKRHSPSQDLEGMFHGMNVFLLPQGVQPRRLQVWKKKLLQMGAKIEENLSERVTHIFAIDFSTLVKQMIHEKLNIPKISLLKYQWLEDCLKSGERLSENPYVLNSDSKGRAMSGQFLGMVIPNLIEARSHSGDLSPSKRSRVDAQGSIAAEGTGNTEDNTREASYTKDKHTYAGDKIPEDERQLSQCSLGGASHHISPSYDASQEPKELDSLYSPPDLNKDVTEIFGKLINIYRALGDERRSFSYYKAILVIEKLPFKIQSAEQVKHLPAIGKSMQDHIKEIVTIGKLSKLEHFEKDEKVRTVTLFGEVWGVGPSTALKLYEKGHRTLDDLKHDGSLTKSQKYGVKYFYDIKKKIPRHEVKDMEMLLQDVGEEILPGVVIVCGGSYRRGKASCGDLDIIITHPDGESHKGFLVKYIQRLKDINFLREDLVFSIHSIEGTDSGIDTYFGLCTYPGREQRHRIDLKVYPRNSYAFGLIAWTGNDVLNRRLRLLAESKGYRLDDTGLYLAARGTSGKRGMKSSTSLSCNTEKEVFDVLGFPWLEPHQRNL